jgi:ribosomal protein S18 acetylase RimI-like enzyme
MLKAGWTMTALDEGKTGITIRPAGRADLERVASLILLGAATQTMTPQEIAAEVQHPAYAQAFAELEASPCSTVFVAERAGVVVGTYQVTLTPGLAARGRKRAKVESVHVAPECRGQGIGAIMMDHAVAFAKQEGAGLVELTSHNSRTDAHRFYARIGFDQSHTGFKKAIEG